MVRLSGEAILVSLAGLDEHALVEAMRAARRLAAWADSLEFAAIAELDRRRQAQADRHGAWTVEMGRALCDEISAALTLSSTGAAIWLSVALALERLLPRTRQALAEGRIDTARARVICDGVIGVRDEIARRVEHLVLPDAPRLTARQLTARVRKAIIDADPQAYAERRGTAEKGRRVELYDNPDGTMDLAARGPARRGRGCRLQLRECAGGGDQVRWRRTADRRDPCRCRPGSAARPSARRPVHPTRQARARHPADGTAPRGGHVSRRPRRMPLVRHLPVSTAWRLDFTSVPRWRIRG